MAYYQTPATGYTTTAAMMPCGHQMQPAYAPQTAYYAPPTQPQQQLSGAPQIPQTHCHTLNSGQQTYYVLPQVAQHVQQQQPIYAVQTPQGLVYYLAQPSVAPQPRPQQPSQQQAVFVQHQPIPVQQRLPEVATQQPAPMPQSTAALRGSPIVMNTRRSSSSNDTNSSALSASSALGTPRTTVSGVPVSQAATASAAGRENKAPTETNVVSFTAGSSFNATGGATKDLSKNCDWANDEWRPSAADPVHNAATSVTRSTSLWN